MSEIDESFEALLASAKAGDTASLEQLVKRYEPKVRVVARVLLGRALRPYLDSLDLVQSVHRSLIMGMRQKKYYLSTPEQLVALAVTFVRRKVARQWRNLQRQQRLSGGQSQVGNLPELLASLSDTRENPAAAAQFSDQLEFLCRHMTTDERRMLEMRLQGYTAAEVGLELGLHPVAVRVRWTRLRRHLEGNGVVADWL